MHVENELLEIVTTDDHEFEEIIEEYEEKVLVSEDILEPPPTDSADTAPVQGKSRCTTSIFIIYRIYMCCAFTLQEFYRNHMHIYIYMSPISAGSSRCYA